MKAFLQHKQYLPAYILGTAVSLYFLIDIICKSLYSGISNDGVYAIGMYSLAIITLQTMICALLTKYYNKGLLVHVLAATFVAANIYCFILAILGNFILSSIFIKSLILAAIFALFLLVFRKGHNAVITVATVSLLLFSIVKLNMTIYDINKVVEYQLPESYQYKEFVRKPNIYFMVYDGLVPEEIAKLHLQDIEEVAYVDKLKEMGGKIIPDAYANDSTMNTLNSMLSMDLFWWFALPEQQRKKLISGVQNSPVYDLLQKNGYHISVMYKNAYLTRGASTKIEYLYYKDGVCDIGTISDNFAFWGYCRFFDDIVVGGHEAIAYMFYQLFRLVNEDSRHKFVMAYWSVPGHSGTNYSWHNKQAVADFNQNFTNNILAAESIIEFNVNMIVENDDDAIILIFGDHGAYFTRGVGVNDGIFTEQQIRDDTNKVLLATFNTGDCNLAGYKEPLLIANVVENFMHCLTGSPELVE